MGLIEALILGIVQGVSEFLPVSSSGHLVLVPAAFGWASPPIVFDTTVHLGTLVAVVAVFWRDLINLIVSWWQGIQHGQLLEKLESRLAWWVILGTVPAVLVGLFFGGFFESLFSNPHAVGAFLLLTAVLLVLAELLGRQRRDLLSMNWLDSLLVGIGQAVAIAPGVSRSGTTMAVGMYCRMTREAAVRFSFLLSVPIIAGAGLMQLAKLAGQDGTHVGATPLMVGFATSAIFGYAAIRWLLAYLHRRPLYPFAIYCIVVGILAITLL